MKRRQKMKLHERFLKEDLLQANEEYVCFRDCLGLMVDHVLKGEIEQAKQRSIDVTKSLHEMSKLAQKKIDFERRTELIKQMQEHGITVQIVRRHFNDPMA